jgi:hypothetical protein
MAKKSDQHKKAAHHWLLLDGIVEMLSHCSQRTSVVEEAYPMQDAPATRTRRGKHEYS